MEILAIGTNLKTSDRKFIANIFPAVLGEEVKVSILDVISHKIKTNGSEIVATFGKKAKDLFTASKEKYIAHLSLPEVKLLAPTEENEEAREQAYQQLLQLKNLSKQEPAQVINEDSLPEVDNKFILASLSASQTKEWQGINKEGKSIKLTLEPTETKTADVNLTFAEFLLLRAAMETLGVKEFQIVTNSRTDNKS